MTSEPSPEGLKNFYDALITKFYVVKFRSQFLVFPTKLMGPGYEITQLLGLLKLTLKLC